MGKKKGKSKGDEEPETPRDDEAAEGEDKEAPADISDAPAAPAAASKPAASADAAEMTISDSIQVAGMSETRHVKVKYCDVCSMPYDMCEWQPLFKKCKERLSETYQEHFPDVEDEEGLAALMQRLWVDDDKAKRAQKSKSGGAAAAAAVASKPASGAEGDGAAAEGEGGGGEKVMSKKEKKAMEAKEIVIELNNRNKKKHITVVKGLEHFHDDPAAAAKLFGKKFACGSALKKGQAGQADCIEIQGSCRDELPAFMVDKLKLNLDNIVVVIDGKKFKAADAPPPSK